MKAWKRGGGEAGKRGGGLFVFYAPETQVLHA
jgi:hypothetical protein